MSGRHALKGNMPLRTLGKEMEARRSAIRAALSGRTVQFATGRHAAIPTPAERAAVTIMIIRNS